MKKIILLAIFIVLSCSVKAQSWCPPGATWHYGLAQPSTGYVKYSYMYDTLVGTDVCQKINAEAHGNGMGGFVINWYGALYTKFDNGIVYKNNGTLAAPQYDTLYCFNCPVGTKWRCQLNGVGGSQSCSQSYIEITGVGSSVIQGQTLNWRQIFYKNYYFYPGGWSESGTDTIFERIGTRHNMEFISGAYCADATDIAPNSFRCYSDFQMNLQMSIVACNYTTGITKNENLSELLSVSNPVNDLLKGTFSDKEYELSIYDALGKIKYCMQHKNSEFSIDVSDYNNGIYFLQLNSSEGIINKKILVQH